MTLSKSKSAVSALQRPLLHTKLCMPRTRAALVVRPRLLDQLNRPLQHHGTARPKLTLITGPAGYGKSTLTMQWIAQLRQPAAWLSLDAGDNDPARFLAYLAAAIGTVHEEIGEAALARLTTTYLYNDAEAILTALLNDLAVYDAPVVVVLDDYHAITADAVHQIMAFVLQHMPVQLHLVVASRAEPPLPVALLRARGMLTHVTQQALRFTPDEAAQFLAQTMAVHLPPDEVAALDEHVEGWVTGLQLAALALQEADGAPQAVSSGPRYVADYLAEQVLARQPAALQAFLLETAVLPQFNAGLCRAVTGRADSHVLLEAVERANLFLIPLDAERRWFRFHHLFADFLAGRLRQQREPADVAALHGRAAAWCAANGQPVVAVEHALAARDFPLAARLMAAAARDLLMAGEGRTLRQWIEALPAALRTAQPALALYYAWALIRTGELAQAAALLDAVADRLETPLAWGEWAALRARLAVITGDTNVNIRFSHKALARLPADEHMLRSEVAINLGFSHLQQADLEAARDAFAEAAQHTAHDPGLWAVMFATYYWGQTFERQGQLAAAADVYRRGLGLAGRENGRRDAAPPAVGFMHVGLGRLLLEWNRLAEAETHLRRALACAERSGDHKMLIYSREAMAQLLAALGDWPAAAAMLDALERQSQAAGPSQLRALLALQRGDAAAARQWAAQLGIGVADTPAQLARFPAAYLTLARLKLAQRDEAGLPALLRRLADLGTALRSARFRLHVALLQAVLCARRGDVATASAHFGQALNLAETGGFVRLVLDYQEPALLRLLHLAAGGGATAGYARLLLGHLGPAGVETAVDPPPTLTPRELDVLHALAAGLANRDVAARLTVSVNTVKSHTRRLYDKLGVRSRAAAVARARALGLLDP